MDHRGRPVYARQRSNNAGTPGTPGSPTMSPLNPRHARAGSVGISNVRKAQTKAAAQRLAQVMSHQSPANDDEEDEDDDLSFDYNAGGLGSIGLAGGRKVQPRSPMTRPAPRTSVQVKTPYNYGDDHDQREKTKPVTARRNPQMRTSNSFANDEEDDDDDGDKAKPMPRPTVAPVKTPYRSFNDDNERTKSAPRNNEPAKKSYHIVDDDEEDGKDELMDDYSSGMAGKMSLGHAGARSMRSRSPAAVRTRQDQQPQPGSSIPFGGRMPLSVKTSEQKPAVQLSSAAFNPVEQPVSSHFNFGPGRMSSSSLDQSLTSRPSMIMRTSTPNSVEQPPSARSALASRFVIKTVPMPSSVPLSLKPVSAAIQSDSPKDGRRDKRLSLDLGSIKIRDQIREPSAQRTSSALQDELDMLMEENESLLEKLRLAEERSQEADARANQLAKQISSLGEGVTMEARLLSRKEAALQQREAALKYAEETNKPEKILALRSEAEAAKDEATSAMEQLQEAEHEIRTLRNMSHRMILTQEEMEEVVMKRCWLARYWNLCVQHGIHSEIAAAKNEYWSSYAPLPNEVVLAAGERAINEDESVNDDAEERETIMRERNDLSGDGSIESMLLVERGLRELAALKIEDTVAVSLACKRRPNLLKPDEVKLPTDGSFDAFELSQEESDEVRFKQAWLTYFWRRAKNHGIEPEVAEERLQFWINHSSRSSTSHDAVDVERGLMELKKLGIETQLWQYSRRGIETDFSSKAHLESHF